MLHGPLVEQFRRISCRDLLGQCIVGSIINTVAITSVASSAGVTSPYIAVVHGARRLEAPARSFEAPADRTGSTRAGGGEPDFDRP